MSTGYVLNFSDTSFAQFFFEVAVSPSKRSEPGLDGSALEHFGRVIDLSLEHALDLCRTGLSKIDISEAGEMRAVDLGEITHRPPRFAVA